jgi:hypothetical protein
MTIDTSQAVIIIDHNNDLHNEINHMHCMARKSDYKQCTNSKKIGDYCKVHSDKQNIIRIDEHVVIKSKRPYTKKNSQETTTNSIKDKVKYCDEIYMRSIDKINRIKTAWRLHTYKKYNLLRGPALWKRELCNNKEDMYTTDSIDTITPTYFFSLLDNDNFIYGFHIETIYKYIEANLYKKEINNPYNNKPISNTIIENIKMLYKYSKSQVTFKNIENELPNTPEFVIKSKVLKVFQKMDELNNYTDIDWFLKLTNIELLKLIHLLRDLWGYRMELSEKNKLSITESGLIFSKGVEYYKKLKFHDLRIEIIQELEKLVFQGKTRDDQYLGSLVILTGLVDISNKCAIAYPWLVQSSFYQ